MSEFLDWTVTRPPLDTWIVMRYELSDDDRVVKTCRRGCCVIDPGLGGCMVLPRWWRFAKDDEVPADAIRKRGAL